MAEDKKLLLECRDLFKSLEFCISVPEYCSVCPECEKCSHDHVGQKGHAKDCGIKLMIEKLDKTLGGLDALSC
jgi:hypothetical protein